MGVHELSSPLSQEAPRRKKLGRPLVYEGDPDTDPTLTEEQRRRIRRRIANRESARRVRDKRLLKMGWMHDQVLSLCLVYIIWVPILVYTHILCKELALFLYNSSSGAQMDVLREEHAELAARVEQLAVHR